MPALIPTPSTPRLEACSLPDDFCARLVGQWSLEMNHVAVVIGGVYRQEKYPDQAGVIHTAVPRARQADAGRVLNENAVTTPLYFLDPERLRRIEPTRLDRKSVV